MSGGELGAALHQLWGNTAPATWNRNRAIDRSTGPGLAAITQATARQYSLPTEQDKADALNHLTTDH
jgi:hypothetical protein